MKKFHLLIFCCITLWLNAQQQLTFTHVDERQGLSSAKVIKLFTDSRGLLWIGALDGLYTFDGYQCTNISTAHPEIRAHLSNGVSGMAEDKKGNIWFSISDGMLNYHRATGKMSYHTFYFDKAHTGQNFCNPFYVDDQNKLWTFICDPSSLSTIDLNSPKLTRDTITSIGNGFCQTTNTKPFQQVKTVAGDLWYGFDIIHLNENGHLNNAEILWKTNDKGERSKIQVHRFHFENDSIYYIASSNGLIKYNIQSKRVILFEQFEEQKITQINSIQARDNILYVGTEENGLLLFDLKKEKYIAQYVHDVTHPFSLSGNTVNTVYIDSSGNLFLGINGSGLDYCNLKLSRLNAHYSENIPELKKQSIAFNTFSPFSDSLILAGTMANGLVLLNANYTITQRWNTSNSNIPSNNIYSLFQATPSATIVGTDKGIALFDHTSKRISVIPPDATAKHFYTEPTIVYIARLNKNEIGFCTPSGFFTISSDLKTFASIDPLNVEAFTNYASFYALSENSFIVNTIGSYCYIIKKGNGKWSIKTKIENFATVHQYFPLDAKHFLLATSQGLQSLDLTANTYKNIQLPIDIACFSITKFDSALLLSTNKGLIKYFPSLNTIQLFDERVNAINKGFKPNAYYYNTKGKLFLGGEKGFNEFVPKQLKYNHQALQPILNKILINDVAFAFDSNINETNGFTFPYSQNTISIEFSAINYNYTAPSKTSYFLEGYDKTAVASGISGNVRYARLPAGDYVFHLRAFEENDSAHYTEKTIEIHITPPYYQTWWFRLLAIAAVAISVWLAFRYRINAIQKEEERKTAYNKSLAEMESRALRSQMNPHFIFNSLNAIQRYIYQHDAEKSANYLTRFARLMRQILENSKHPFITLDEEINSVETYIELEKMRFENKFESVITVSQAIEREHTLIPPLLLQPYVENAIWHGLMHKETPGLLKINISLTADTLLIIIEDNGVGRAASAVLKSKPKQHISTALKATEERLLLINRTTGKKVDVNIIDLINSNSEPCGTQVVISMPLIED
jgi:hypothetical protein